VHIRGYKKLSEIFIFSGVTMSIATKMIPSTIARVNPTKKIEVMKVKKKPAKEPSQDFSGSHFILCFPIFLPKKDANESPKHRTQNTPNMQVMGKKIVDMKRPNMKK